MGNYLYVMVNFKADEYKRIMFTQSVVQATHHYTPYFFSYKHKLKLKLSEIWALEGSWLVAKHFWKKNPFKRTKTLLNGDNGDVFT